jgi:hypothetical protein
VCSSVSPHAARQKSSQSTSMPPFLLYLPSTTHFGFRCGCLMSVACCRVYQQYLRDAVASITSGSGADQRVAAGPGPAAASDGGSLVPGISQNVQSGAISPAGEAGMLWYAMVCYAKHSPAALSRQRVKQVCYAMLCTVL